MSDSWDTTVAQRRQQRQLDVGDAISVLTRLPFMVGEPTDVERLIINWALDVLRPAATCLIDLSDEQRAKIDQLTAAHGIPLELDAVVSFSGTGCIFAVSADGGHARLGAPWRHR